MLSLYRLLLNLYPASYRDEFADEMLAVLSEVQAESASKRWFPRAVSCAREAGGLLYGALQEHIRSITYSHGRGMFSPRRLTMRSEYRFPKATVTLMAIILAGILMAIDKARAISAAVPPSSTYVPPLHSAEFTVLPALLLMLAGACTAGVIGWAILFALRRSGVHRLSDVNPSGGQRSGTKLSI
jgi:hypothetical protein